MENCQSGLNPQYRIRQGCNLSLDLFNMIFEAMMKKALTNVLGLVVVDGRIVNNLRFADDIDLHVSESSQQLQELTSELNESMVNGSNFAYMNIKQRL